MARSLAELVAEEQQRIEAQFRPLSQSPRYSLLRVLASLAVGAVRAGAQPHAKAFDELSFDNLSHLPRASTTCLAQA